MSTEPPAAPPARSADHELVLSVRDQGLGRKLAVYTRLSGPGWLQSAITLGGGSLAGSLYLGVLGGFGLLWLQPVAMALGVVMLSAIGYVTLSTGERPFQAINRHVNPVLGWSWAIATLMANMVWALPQFGLATGAIQQNLAPGLLGAGGPFGDTGGKLIVVGAILVLTISITWMYDTGGWGVKLYELILKAMVGLIVLCFFGVVVKLSLSPGGLDWGAVLRGFVPDLSTLTRPTPGFQAAVDLVDPAHRDFWTAKILGPQRDTIITACATAVGINMTFLLGYSMLSRGWNRDFRGLAIFDLSTGMFIPFVAATSCVVIAAANMFYAAPAPGLLGETDASGAVVKPAANLVGPFEGLLAERAASEAGADAWAAMDEGARKAAAAALPEADRRMAAMLVKRDAGNLAAALQPLTGPVFANVIFGLGVVGMGVSTITILMLISGFVICEMLGLPPKGWPHRFGCLAAATGALGPFFWKEASVYLAMPTSVFGMALLPIAYFTFFVLMNQKRLLGDDMPKGTARVVWNVLMALAASFAAIGSIYSVGSKLGAPGLVGMAAFVALVVGVQLTRKPAARA